MRGEDAGHRGVSDADIKEILDYHNRSESESAGQIILIGNLLSKNKSNLFNFKASHLPALR